jgi:hypothetical protein
VKKRALLFAASSVTGALLMISAPMFAHHSDAEWNQTPLITIEGTVTQWKFINPHSEIHLEVKDDKGNVEQWIVFCCVPNTAARAGMSSKSFVPGETLAITGHPSRYGRKTMQHEKIVRANGELVRTNKNTPRDQLK